MVAARSGVILTDNDTHARPLLISRNGTLKKGRVRPFLLRVLQGYDQNRCRTPMLNALSPLPVSVALPTVNVAPLSLVICP
jgi:hypothetical protein